MPCCPCAQFVDGIVKKLTDCTSEMTKLLDTLDDKVYFTSRKRVRARTAHTTSQFKTHAATDTHAPGPTRIRTCAETPATCVDGHVLLMS